MLKNFLKTAFRNFWKQKRYHSINFIGLTVGLSCCALVVLYLQHELSYDRFHHDPDNTYRITGQAGYGPWFPIIGKNYAEQLFQDKFPEIEKVTRFRRSPRKFIHYQDKKFSTSVIITDHGSEFFDIFNFEVIEGTVDQMLKAPHSAVMTRQTAENLLGEAPYSGKIIQWDTLTLQVTGVLEDIPENSHLDFGMLITHRPAIDGAFTYITIPAQTNTKHLESRIQALDVATNIYDTLLDVRLQRLSGIHLEKALTYEMKPPGNKNYLYLFSGIALFVLIISCTNYINLSAAIYSGRNKEIAVRKVLGGTKSSLSFQFLLESVLMSLLTVPAVILVVETVLPLFSNFLEISFENIFVSSWQALGILLAIAIFTGALAGIYPALTLPHFSPLKLLKKGGITDPRGLRIRKVLLTLQFTILLILGTGAFFVNKQLQYIKNKDLGIERDGIVKISNVYSIEGNDKYNTLKSRFLSNPNILGFTTGIAPGTEDYGLRYIAEGHEERTDALSFGTDFDYFSVMGVEPLYGGFFNKTEEELPKVSLLVNDHFVKLMGWENPIGKKVTTSPGAYQNEHFIAGVFKSYHSQSLHQELLPQFIFVRKTRRFPSENILVKINMKDIQASFKAIEDAWYEIMSDSPIHYEFIDEDIQAAYKQEEKVGTLSTILSILAITLAVMGLVGLAAYLAELRTKEVGIRKVLGAPILQLLILLNREFIALVILATIIASALSFYTTSQWLDTFAYRTSVDFIVFPLAGILVFTITFITVCIQSAKTAMQNPIKALRHE